MFSLAQDWTEPKKLLKTTSVVGEKSTLAFIFETIAIITSFVVVFCVFFILFCFGFLWVFFFVCVFPLPGNFYSSRANDHGF